VRWAFGFALLAALLASPYLSAQSPDEDLFGGGNAVVSTPADATKDLATSAFEATKTVAIGGDISIVQSVDLGNGAVSQTKGARTQSLGLYFDARPSDSFRVYGRGQYDMANSLMSGAFSVQELFADLSWNRKLSLRVGKQTANWGLGWWWSPADILSLTPIDQSDPGALRSGPVALKASLPIGLGQASAYATTQGAMNVDQVGLAARYEFVLGTSEFGIGGYWRKDGSVAPRLVGTASLRFLGIDWYAEAVGFGSGPPAVRLPDGLLCHGAAGFSWIDMDKEGRWEARANGEYYYNGRGSGGASAISGYGRQYAGAGAAAEDLWASKLGVDAEWRSNLGDASGYARGAAVYEPISDVRLEAGCEAYYGQDGSEYAAMNGGVAAAYAVASLRLWTNTTVDIAWPFSGNGARPRLSLVFCGQF
jgi:hypothetical protein